MAVRSYGHTFDTARILAVAEGQDAPSGALRQLLDARCADARPLAPARMDQDGCAVRRSGACHRCRRTAAGRLAPSRSGGRGARDDVCRRRLQLDVGRRREALAHREDQACHRAALGAARRRPHRRDRIRRRSSGAAADNLRLQNGAIFRQAHIALYDRRSGHRHRCGIGAGAAVVFERYAPQRLARDNTYNRRRDPR